MGLVEPIHLVIVAAVALIVIGPRRLPELTHAFGRAVHEFREAMAASDAGAEEPREHGHG